MIGLLENPIIQFWVIGILVFILLFLIVAFILFLAGVLFG